MIIWPEDYWEKWKLIKINDYNEGPYTLAGAEIICIKIRGSDLSAEGFNPFY